MTSPPEEVSDPVHILAGPAKHSITIAGHQTSISLEPLFWEALQRAAKEEELPLNSLVARIDELRITALTRPLRDTDSPPANLASAIRSWLWARYCK